jgi:hypothetical protein
MLGKIEMIQQTKDGIFAVDLTDSEMGIKRVTFQTTPDSPEDIETAIAYCWLDWHREATLPPLEPFYPQLSRVIEKINSYLAMDAAEDPPAANPVDAAEDPPAANPVDAAEDPPAANPVDAAEDPPAANPVDAAEDPPAANPVE